MDELETAPPTAYSKPLGRLKTGFRGSPTQAPKAAYYSLRGKPDTDPSGTYHRPSGQLIASLQDGLKQCIQAAQHELPGQHLTSLRGSLAQVLRAVLSQAFGEPNTSSPGQPITSL